ncbi:probable FUN14 domain-containing protein 1 at C-terminar half [Coccomyxa sp. Obi]|nr:probable FUN14 domain-containing protein 1 at C-terminar half [Coccomyxa sp. Obi]
MNTIQAWNRPADVKVTNLGRNKTPSPCRLPGSFRPFPKVNASSSTGNHIPTSCCLQNGGGGGCGGGNNSHRFVSDYDGDHEGGIQRAFALATVFALVSALSPSAAQALSLKKKKKKQPTNRLIENYSDHLVTIGWPIAQNLGFSGALGFATAFALKAVGSALALGFGLLFIVVQGAAYLGYIEVKWTVVHKEVIRRLDVNQDGKFDASDLKSLVASGLAVLAEGVPSVGGFLAGFALGLR